MRYIESKMCGNSSVSLYKDGGIDTVKVPVRKECQEPPTQLYSSDQKLRLVKRNSCVKW